MQENSHCTAPLEVKFSADSGMFEGYASIFDQIDSDGDRIEKGAFIESLKSKLPAMLWQHNMKEPIGKFTHVEEDDVGLYVKGHLAQEGRGREAYSLLKMGAINGLSVGFVCQQAVRDKKDVRVIKQADLVEISLVTFPANAAARVSVLKNKKMATDQPPVTLREFEKMLRKNGYSKRVAKSIALHGYDKGCQLTCTADMASSPVAYKELARSLFSRAYHMRNIIR